MTSNSEYPESFPEDDDGNNHKNNTEVNHSGPSNKKQKVNDTGSNCDEDSNDGNVVKTSVDGDTTSHGNNDRPARNDTVSTSNPGREHASEEEEDRSDDYLSTEAFPNLPTLRRLPLHPPGVSCPMRYVVDTADEIMISIFTYLPICEQGKNKLVCKRWVALNTTSIEQSPKKAFETNEELRKAVLIYCNQGGWVWVNGLCDYEVPSPTRSQRQMVWCVYGLIINDWNVSKITDFTSVFLDCTQFNEDISAWNTANATLMRYMFNCARTFNQPLNRWNVSKVGNMQYMFNGASSFNQTINTWNTSNVMFMQCMFRDASAFSQSLNQWKTHNVEDMYGMFSRATLFNQPLNAWDTSNVKNMMGMFSGAISFNQPLHTWDTSKVKNMMGMFNGASSFNHPINMWDTRAITHPHKMPLYYAP